MVKDEGSIADFEVDPKMTGKGNPMKNSGFTKTTLKCKQNQVFNYCIIQLVNSEEGKPGHLGNITIRGSKESLISLKNQMDRQVKQKSIGFATNSGSKPNPLAALITAPN